MATKKATPKTSATETPVVLDRAALVAKFNADLNAQLDMALDEFNAEKIVKAIVGDMKREQQQLVQRVLGIDNRYGSFEVDHCNGRMSNITEFVNATCAVELKAALGAMVKEEVEKLKEGVPAKFKAAVVKELNKSWDNVLEREAKRVAEQLAAQCAQDFRREIMGVHYANP